MQDVSKVISKIKKLMALAEGNTTIEESLSALGKAQELMDEYNISLSDVEDYTPENSEVWKNDYFHLDPLTPIELRSLYGWRRMLMHQIGLSLHCEGVYKRNGDGMWLVGEEQNIEFSKFLFAYLTTQFEILLNRDWDNYFGAIKKTPFANTWLKAATMTVSQRLRALRVEREKAVEGTGSALMVLRDNKAKEALQRYHPNLRFGPTTKINLDEAYLKGKEAGNSVNLQRPLEGAAFTQLGG